MNLHRSTLRTPAASVRRAALVLAILAAAVGGGLALSLNAATGPARLAPTPPLGWNSFDSYGVYLHQPASITKY
jgi:hypothetical protein